MLLDTFLLLDKSVQQRIAGKRISQYDSPLFRSSQVVLLEFASGFAINDNAFHVITGESEVIDKLTQML